MDDVLRLLEVVQRELGANDARLELGGREPGPDAVWCTVEQGYRLVAIYDGELPQPAEALRDRLRILVASFPTSLQQMPRPRRRVEPQAALDDALDVLRQQTHAAHAIVVDDNSPVLWGTSATRSDEDLTDAFHAAEALTLSSAAGIDLAAVLSGEAPSDLPTELASLTMKIREAAPEGRDRAEWSQTLRNFAAMVAVRNTASQSHVGSRLGVRDPDLAFLARHFAGIYWLVLVFEDANFSELHAEAAMIHALPWIERLVEALPPVDPDEGGRVVRLRHLRPV